MSIFEPSADARVAAKQMWDLYSACREQGFTEDQAMNILLAMVSD